MTYSASDDEALKHYGVKGMKWGVRKAEDRAARRSAKAAEEAAGNARVLAEYETMGRDIKSSLKSQGITSESLQAKYGPEPTTAADNAAQKKLIRNVAIGVGVASAVGTLYYLNRKDFAIANTRVAAYANARDGLALHWDKGVELPKGSVLKRLSTVAESQIRENGFYACFKDSDVESYKAILPQFWQEWGKGSAKAGGFLNHYTALSGVKAPSGKESVDIFRKLYDSNETFRLNFGATHAAKGLTGAAADDVYKQLFQMSAFNWVDNDAYMTKTYFAAVKAAGFNALIDFNDAGKLGNTPLRVIDSSIFKITNNERMTINDFYSAAKKWTPELIHAFIASIGDILVGRAIPIRERKKE